MRAEHCTSASLHAQYHPLAGLPLNQQTLRDPCAAHGRIHAVSSRTWGHAGPHLRIGKRPLPLASWSSLLRLGICARTFRQAGAMLSPCARSSRHHAPGAVAEVRPRTLKRAPTVLTSRLRRLHSSVCRPGSRLPLAPDAAVGAPCTLRCRQYAPWPPHGALFRTHQLFDPRAHMVRTPPTVITASAGGAAADATSPAPSPPPPPLLPSPLAVCTR